MVGGREGHPDCKKLVVGLLVVTIWLEFCTTCSCGCQHYIHHRELGIHHTAAIHSMYHSLFILMAIFPVGPGLVGTGMTPVWTLLELRMMDKVVTSEPTSCAKLQSNRHHQQTNTQLFTVGMPFLSPNQQCQSTEGKLSSNKIQNGDILLPANPGPTGVFPIDIIRGFALTNSLCSTISTQINESDLLLVSQSEPACCRTASKLAAAVKQRPWTPVSERRTTDCWLPALACTCPPVSHKHITNIMSSSCLEKSKPTVLFFSLSILMAIFQVNLG